MHAISNRYTILVGHYGSGKTELAIALARHKRKMTDQRVVLVDLDIVNPYFRSAEKQTLLESEGIEVIKPTFALTGVDVPALPAQVQAVFAMKDAQVIIDVGGDDTGATALGRYFADIQEIRDEVSLLFVVNAQRPFTSSKEDIVALYRLITNKARLEPDYLVNNANLQEYTSHHELIKAQEMLEGVARVLQVPIGLIAGRKELVAKLPPPMQSHYFAFEPLMKPAWLVEE